MELGGLDPEVLRVQVHPEDSGEPLTILEEPRSHFGLFSVV